MGNRREKLVVEERVLVTKEAGQISVKSLEKSCQRLLRQIPLRKVALRAFRQFLSIKIQKYNMVFREMQYDIPERKMSGKAYSLYLGIEDEDATTYLEGNIVPLGENKGAIFLSIISLFNRGVKHEI